MTLPASRDALDYAPYYCEENIWRLLSSKAFPGDAWAVLIFGLEGRAAMLEQRAGRDEDGFVLWDYHAVALVSDPSAAGLLVFDFDTRLDFPLPAEAYLKRSFIPPNSADPVLARFEPVFRLLPAIDFSANFYSDRSHMKASDGSWLQSPPPWDHPGERLATDGPIRDSWRLGSLIDPRRKERGQLLSLGGLARFISGARSVQ